MNFLADMLKDLFVTDALKDNLEYIFITGINNSTIDAGHELATLPSTWNPTLWSYIATLNQQIFLPIASTILVLGIAMEIYSMVVNNNGMHDWDIQNFFMLLLKVFIAYTVVKNVYPLLLGIFDISAFAINKAAAIAVGGGSIPSFDIEAYMATLKDIPFGQCLMLLFMSMLVRLTLWIFNLAISVLVAGRMIQIYLYCSVAAIPAAAIISKEMDMSKNYFKNMCALGLQGFLMMFCLGAYTAIIKNLNLTNDVNGAMLQVLIYSTLLIFMLFKTSSIAKSVMNSH